MIKPIVYHDIRQKKKLEVALFSKIPLEKRMAVSQELIDLFSSLRDPDGDRVSMSEITQITRKSWLVMNPRNSR